MSTCTHVPRHTSLFRTELQLGLAGFVWIRPPVIPILARRRLMIVDQPIDIIRGNWSVLLRVSLALLHDRISLLRGLTASDSKLTRRHGRR
jgi:hypothetical protein